MSYGIQTKKLKRLIDFYSPFNNGQQLKFLTLFKGQQGLLRYLQTSSFQGIDSTSIQQRKSWFGSNSPNNSLTPTLTSLLLSPLSSITLKCYLMLSIVCLIIQIIEANKQGKYSYLGSIVNITIFIIIYTILISLSVFQYSSNKILRKYCQRSSISKVWRDNQRKQIQSGELVIGDVVELTAGDYIGADGIVIDGNIKVSQPMSYQQITVQKCNTKMCLRARVSSQQKQDQFILQQLQQNQPQKMPSPIVLAGSQVISGDARYVVLCVGKNSRIGYFIQQVHRAAKQRKSEVQKKINQIVFQITKYLILGLILFVVLYICKIIGLVIITKDVVGQDWGKIFIGLARGMSLGLMGLPIQQIIGLTLGSIYIKLNIYNTDRIWYKYSKDCGTIRDITTIILANPENKAMIDIKKWWNMKQHTFQSYQNSGLSCEQNVNEAYKQDSSYSSSNYSKDKYSYHGGNDVCESFQMMFIQSLRCRDFCPKEVGLKFGSFFIGRNSRFVTYIQQQLKKIANHRNTTLQKHPNFQPTNPYKSSKSQLSMQSEQNKDIQIIYLKGNSQTMLKQCTHILCPKSCKPLLLTSQLREQIQEKMRKLNISQQPSLITAYIEVNPKHPKFRQSNYKFVMISLISYQQNHDNEEFQSLARMKGMGIGITLVSNSEHMETVALAKQMGIVMIDKPSIRLTGYDFYKVVNGIICRTCKKAICICTDQNKYVPSLKNQDQFNRIYKHLNVLSEANSLQKQALAIGLQSAQEKVCFFGTSIEDVPAMRLSTIGASVTSQLSDPYIENTSQIFLPNSRLLTLEKLINWGHLHYEFCRKYLIFAVTPCLVAFISSFVCYLLYNNHCIQLIQFIWVSVVLCPLLGVGLVIAYPHKLDNFVGTRNNQPFIDRVSYRHISSQVITQVLIIFLVLFFGPNFIPQQPDNIDSYLQQYSSKYLTNSNQTICPGISQSIFNNMQPVYEKTFIKYGIYSRHMTIIFNIFVLMQILNYINCYKLKLSNKIHPNTLENNNNNNVGSNLGEIVKDKVIIFITIFIVFGLQVFVVHAAGSVLELYPNGLTFKQWAISIGLALIVLLVGLIVSQLPYDLDNQQLKGKVWPNRCYNLAVMATVARESLQDLQIDEQLEVKKMAMMNQ